LLTRALFVSFETPCTQALWSVLNTHHSAWNYFDWPADEWVEEHWERLRSLLERLVSGAA